jgi:hypothetical protein
MIWLSIWKRGSTVLHFQAWFDGISALLANPWGYGLGSSGPSVHYEWVYLPENQYLQVGLDLGVWGLVGWIGVWVVLLKWVWSRLRNWDLITNNSLSHWVKRSGIEVECDSTEIHPVVNDNTFLRSNSGQASSVWHILWSRDSWYWILIPLLLWGAWLAVIGMFLHVLEDSMVNYRYLSLLWITIGSVLTCKKIWCSQ